MNAKETVMLVSGLLIGASGGYLVAKHVLDAKYAKIVDETVAEVKEAFDARVAHIVAESELRVSAAEDNIANTPHIQTPPTNEELEAAVEAKRGHTGESFVKPVPDDFQRNPHNARTDYAGASKVVTQRLEEAKSNVEVILNDESIGDDPTKWPRDRSKPYVISVAEFQEGFEGNGSETLHYFDQDDVLADPTVYKEGSDNGIITDNRADDMIGLKNLKHFGKGAQDEDFLYIRNEALYMDFEIMKLDESYTQKIFGMDPTDFDDEPESKTPRKMRGHD